MNLGHAPLALACGSAALLVAPWLTRLIQRAIAQRSPEGRHGQHAQAAVAAVTALGFAATALHFGPRAELPVYLFLIAALVVLSFVDLATKTLPRRLVHMALAVGIVLLTPIAVFMGEPQRVLWATVGALGAFAVLTVLHVVARGGLGYGDVRLGAMLGWFVAWEGLRHVPVGLFLAFVSSAVVGLALIASGRASRRTAIPFGPFLAIGGVLALLGGSLSAA
jgi:leader peptidase (prepilin peptidase)/N-methyltransferase